MLFFLAGNPRFNYVATRYSESGFAGFLIPPALRVYAYTRVKITIVELQVNNATFSFEHKVRLGLGQSAQPFPKIELSLISAFCHSFLCFATHFFGKKVLKMGEIIVFVFFTI